MKRPVVFRTFFGPTNDYNTNVTNNYKYSAAIFVDRLSVFRFQLVNSLVLQFLTSLFLEYLN